MSAKIIIVDDELDMLELLEMIVSEKTPHQPERSDPDYHQPGPGMGRHEEGVSQPPKAAKNGSLTKDI